MSRTVSEMSPDDRQAYQTYQLRLESHASTAAEKVDARQKMEELEWKGKAGGVFSAIDAVEQRLAKVEAQKGGGKAANCKKELAEIDERLTAIATKGLEREDAILDVRSIAEANHDEVNKLRADLGKASTLIREDQKTVGNVQKRQGEDSKTVAKMMTAIEARLAKLEQFQTDAIADMIDEAKTAIHAEAQAAAKTAVAELMGDD